MSRRARECLMFCAGLLGATLFGLALLYLLSILGGCAGPYQGPDVTPDRFTLGYGRGRSEATLDPPFQAIAADEQSSTWYAEFGWDLRTGSPVEVVDARRNELLSMMLEEVQERPGVASSSASPDSASAFREVLAAIQEFWFAFLLAAIAFTALGLAPVLRKRLAPKTDSTND